MSLIFADGFDLYGSVADVIQSGLWFSETSVVVTPGAGRFNGVAIGGTIDDSGWRALIRSTDDLANNTHGEGDTLIIGWYYKIDNATMNNDVILTCFSGSNFQCGLRHTSLGALQARDDADNAVGSNSADGVIVPDTWHYIEFKVLIGAGSSGAITVHVDEVEVIATISSIDTFSGSYNTVSFTGDNSQWLIDDVVIMDDRGAKNNDFLGETRITTLLPEGDTSQNDWAQSSSGDTHSLVNKPALGNGPDDSEYIEARVSSDETRITFEAPPNNLDLVHAIASVYQCRKTDVSDSQVEALIRSNGVDEVTHKGVIIDDYCTNRFIHEDDLGAGSPTEPWNEASLTAIEMGVRIV